MWRHWLLVLVALLLTAPVARAIGDEVDPVYEARGTLLLLSPAKTYSSDGKTIEVNPFSRSGNAERVAAGAVLTVSHTTRWKDRMIAAGATGKYDYRLVSEVVMEVTVTDKTSDRALNTLAVAIRLLEDELAQRQQRAGAPRETWIYVDILAIPETATVLLGSRIRATAGVAALGMAVAATLAFVAEALRIGGGRRRRRRRDQREERHKRPRRAERSERAGRAQRAADTTVTEEPFTELPADAAEPLGGHEPAPPPLKENSPREPVEEPDDAPGRVLT